MRMVIGALLSVMVAMSGCGLVGPSSYRLSGDIFVTMKSGDVKRGAGLEVVLIPDTPEFQAAWAEMSAVYRPSIVSALRSIKEDADKYWMKERNEEQLNFWKLLYAGAAIKVAGRHATGLATRTDANGHYEVTEVKPGKYVVFASTVLFDRPISWLVPIDLAAPGGTRKLDLSNTNEGLS